MQSNTTTRIPLLAIHGFYDRPPTAEPTRVMTQHTAIVDGDEVPLCRRC